MAGLSSVGFGGFCGCELVNIDSSTDDFGGGDLCLVGDPAFPALPGLFLGGRPGERFGALDLALLFVGGEGKGGGGCFNSAFVLMGGVCGGGTGV